MLDATGHWVYWKGPGGNKCAGISMMNRITAGKEGEHLIGGSVGVRGRSPQGASWCRERLWGAGDAARQAEPPQGPVPSVSPASRPAAPSACCQSETALMHQNAMGDLVPCSVAMAKLSMVQNEHSTG